MMDAQPRSTIMTEKDHLEGPSRGAKESATASPGQGEAQEAGSSEQNDCHSKEAALSKHQNPNLSTPTISPVSPHSHSAQSEVIFAPQIS